MAKLYEDICRCCSFISDIVCDFNLIRCVLLFLNYRYISTYTIFTQGFLFNGQQFLLKKYTRHEMRRPQNLALFFNFIVVIGREFDGAVQVFNTGGNLLRIINLFLANMCCLTVDQEGRVIVVQGHPVLRVREICHTYIIMS